MQWCVARPMCRRVRARRNNQICGRPQFQDCSIDTRHIQRLTNRHPPSDMQISYLMDWHHTCGILANGYRTFFWHKGGANTDFFVNFVYLHLKVMNLKKLLTRTISGLIYCVIIVGCTLFGPEGVLLLGGVLAILACIEFAKISKELTRRTIPVIILDIAGCLFLSLGYLIYPLCIWLAIMIFRMIEQLYINSEKPLADLSHSFMSQFYIGVPLGLMVATSWLLSPKLIMVIFFLIWINDTGHFLWVRFWASISCLNAYHPRRPGKDLPEVCSFALERVHCSTTSAMTFSI